MMGLGELTQDELKRRIEAARILRGIDQAKLDEHFDSDGLGKSAGRLERGDVPLTRARLDSLVRHLRVTSLWFTSRDIDALLLGIGIQDDDENLDTRLRRIERQQEVSQERMEEILRQAEERGGVLTAEQWETVERLLDELRGLRPPDPGAGAGEEEAA